jgi:hypothetical protein
MYLLVSFSFSAEIKDEKLNGNQNRKGLLRKENKEF